MSNLKIPVNKKDHIKGNPKAPVTLVEYGDFECPYCRQAWINLRILEKEVGDKYKLVYRHFPLTQIHPRAHRAACAAEAAGYQDKFWEMHDMLFENQDALEDEDLIRYAKKLGIDVDQFIADLESPGTSSDVMEDFMSGIRSGVNGTPTFFINGRRFDGSFQYDSLLTAIVLAAREKKGGRMFI